MTNLPPSIPSNSSIPPIPTIPPYLPSNKSKNKLRVFIETHKLLVGFIIAVLMAYIGWSQLITVTGNKNFQINLLSTKIAENQAELNVFRTQEIKVSKILSATPVLIFITPTLTSTPLYTPTITLTPTNTVAPTKTPLPSATPKPTATEDPLKYPKEDGLYLVNVDIAPGVWRSQAGGDYCYWELTTATGSIISNFFGMSGGTIYIPASAFQVQLQDCGTWTFLQNP